MMQLNQFTELTSGQWNKSMKYITRSALMEYNKLLKAHLLVIDDIMMFALEKKQAVQLFNFINHLHEKASFIITTNKSS